MENYFPIHGRPNRQRGILLLEALLAILIFSIGILAIVGLQGTAINLSAEAKNRVDASLLANQLIGQMWTTNQATLQTDFSTGGSAYTAWRSNVMALPGAQANPPQVVINNSGVATIDIWWQQPNDARVHHYRSVSQIRK